MLPSPGERQEVIIYPVKSLSVVYSPIFGYVARLASNKGWTMIEFAPSFCG